MTTLITGVGAVGSQVAARLQQMGEPVVVYDLKPRLDFLSTVFDVDKAKIVVGDVNDIPRLTETIKSEKVDRLVHLAGYLTRELKNQPFEGVHLNILGTGSALEAARLTGIKRFVFASTRGVNLLAAPMPNGQMLDEDFTFKVLSNRPKTMYEVSKLTGEYLGLIYHELYGVDFAAIRLGGGFGPSPAMPKGLTGGVLWNLVRPAALGNDVTITDPVFTYAGRHEFVYLKDDAEAVAAACFKEGLTKRVYNVRMERTYAYMEVVDIVRTVFPKVKIDIQAVSNTSMSPGHEPRNDFADTAAARTELGWEPKYDLESGIREWGDWFRKTKGAF